MRKRSDAESHSIPSNIFYIMKLFFSIAPGLVIVSFFIDLTSSLPSRLVSVIGVKYIIDRVSDGDTSKVLYAVILIGVIIVLSETLRAVVFELYTHKQKERLAQGLSRRLYSKAAQLDLANYDDPKFYSDFILAVQTSSEHIQWVLDQVIRYVTELISIITIASVVVTVDPWCLLIVGVFVAAFIPIGRKHGAVMLQRRLEITERHRRSDYFGRVFYLPEYAGELRMNGVTPLLRRRFDESADEVISTQKRFVKKLALLDFAQQGGVLVVGFMLSLMLYLGYRTIQTGDMTVGEFVASFNGASQIGLSVLNLTVFSVRVFTERSKIIEKFRVFLSAEPKMSSGEKKPDAHKGGTLELDRVSFTYEGNDRPSVDDVSMSVKPGEHIALVGYNGAGKTTLTNLLLRLYDVTEGSIRIDGTDIRDDDVKAHRRRFSAVFQDFQIFGASVGENVAMSPDYDSERVLDALKKAGFTKELPEGADTLLLREFSDGGMMLSGGEQQKIALARVFYNNTPFVILDEPSANLDPVSEYELNRVMSEAARDRTVIFISHRLSTTRHADRIYMMERGKIIEQGTHEELMELGGKYAYMFDLQAEKYRQ